MERAIRDKTAENEAGLVHEISEDQIEAVTGAEGASIDPFDGKNSR